MAAKYVVIGGGAGATMDRIREVYPRHKAVVDQFEAAGEIIGIGPLRDGGNMAIFRSRASAEAFAAQDPFVLEGLVAGYEIREWLDELLS